MMMALSRIMVAFSDPSLMRDFSSRTIGIAHRECAVEPPSSSKPAMPELAGYGCGNFTLQTDGFQQKVEGKFFATTTSTLYKKGFGYWTVVLDSCHYLVERCPSGWGLPLAAFLPTLLEGFLCHN